MLHRPVEPAQYVSFAFTERLIEAGVDASVGVEHVELETLNYVDWFNHERPHEALDDLTPCVAEELHYAARNELTPTG